MHATLIKLINSLFYLIPLVWLFADPVFFVDYGGKSLIKYCNGVMRPKFYLWELEIRECKFAKKHLEFEGVFVCSVSNQCQYMHSVSFKPGFH